MSNSTDHLYDDWDDDSSDGAVCRTTISLRAHPGFGVLLWLAVVFSSTAIVLNILFARIVWRFTVYHVNLRLLLVNICAYIIWMCLSRSIKSLYIFFSLYTAADPCSFLIMRRSACKAISAITVSHPSTLVSLGSLGVGLERTYGLFRYRAYHKKTKRSLWLSLTILVGVLWTPSILPQLYTSIFVRTNGDGQNSNRSSSNSMMPLCFNLLTFQYEDARIMLAAYSATQAASLFIWILVYCLSRRLLTKISINRAQQSLAARFQLSQNFGVIRTLSPWVAAHFLFHSLYLILEWLLVEKSILRLNYTNRVCLMYAAYLVQLIYSMSFPLICVSRSIVLRKRLAKMINALKRLIGLGRKANIIQPDNITVIRNGGGAMANGGGAHEIEKDGNTSNGFHLTEIKSISATAAFTTPDKAGVKKRVQRIHVFSTLE